MGDEEVSVNIETLSKKRDCVKARLTLFKKHLEEVEQLSVSSPDGILAQEILDELESRLTILNSEVWPEFNESQGLVELYDDNLEEQVKERELFENLYHKISVKYKRLIADGKKGPNILPDSTVNGISVDMRVAPKLPSIPVPKFKGLYENWLEFRDTFESLIHNNKSIADIEKFHFLRGALEGDAKEVVHSLEFSAANYKTAWNLLCERYNNTSYLINNHVKLLFSLPQITRESASDLRKLLDAMVKHLRSLKTLGQCTDNWDVMIIFLVTSKLDSVTFREWEETKSRNRLPTLDEFKDFLKYRAELLESLEVGRVDKPIEVKKAKAQSKSQQLFVTTTQSCSYCKGNHYLNNCADFLKLTVYKRFEHARRSRLCLNCLKRNHMSKDCNSRGCQKCQAKHHTLLHYDKKPDQVSNTNEVSQNEPEAEVSIPMPSTSQDSRSVVMSTSNVDQGSDVLLSTAMVQVVDGQGYARICRILLDSGSQSNLITLDACKKLGVKMKQVNLSIVGIGQVVSEIKSKCEVTIQSVHNAFQKSISCLVVPKISENIPSRFINVSQLNIPKHLKLADPNFHVPGCVDILIGAPLFYELLCIGQVQLGENMQVLQKTRCGWIISGPISLNASSRLHCSLSINLDVQQQLAKFWEIEEPSSVAPVLSEDDKRCEEIFVTTTTRDNDKRFQVEIPFKDSPERLGDSKQQAVSRFYALENRLLKNSKLRQMYTDFMVEYEAMGHMTRVHESSDDKVSYYFPHHGVLNESSATTKLRVVFNGSAPSDTGVSLNDLQFVGPKIQDDLIHIILRFRQHNVVACADIAKMYRMVQVKPSQRSLQKIVWRNNPSEELRIFTLNTVTYGTASAPFLAIRCLKQLGYENLDKYPKAAEAILHDFYVDDLLTGGQSVEEVTQVCREISSILHSGCFELRKWVSNRDAIVQNMSGTEQSPLTVQFGEKSEMKTLGLYWSSTRDVLMYNIAPMIMGRVTKRIVLSDIARIFDPLGLLSPCIISAKIILKKLWEEKLSWGESLPSDLDRKWREFRKEIQLVNNLKVPRQVICSDLKKVQLHGFSDASMEAYGACVYVRSIGSSGSIQTALVMAKSKVAPVKTKTIPRLELCGALVLAQIVDKIKMSMSLEWDDVYLWCDSSVTLSWIATSPNVLQTFIGNRVSQIQTLTELSQWHHIRSEDNPADCLSRGLSPEELLSYDLWWHGPKWLLEVEERWPKSPFEIIKEVPERRKTILSCQGRVGNPWIDFYRFSNLSRLKRAVVYVFRFISKCRDKSFTYQSNLTAVELEMAMKALVKCSQRECFHDEIRELESGKPLCRGQLLGLNPFLDEDGILRVGGRLQLSEFSFEKKHPAVLSSTHPLTKLIFSFEHIRLLHAGPQLLLSSIREKYWPLRGRNLAKSTVHKCIKCFHAKPVNKSPIMGMLPELRVRPMPPFYSVGIDYGGPFRITSKYGRGAKSSKCYVALFVCFTTKAIHLELVSTLTTESFIATFRRFVSRRGKPKYVFSDNGLNFVGANAELKDLGNFLRTHEHQLVNVFENEGVTWKFIPAHSPHFGGLWEAGIKASKFHLKRVMANASLTFEDLCTMLTQIEAVLNSRPLTPLSEDPNDLDPLTPAHFLIGKRLTTLPDPDVQDIKENRLSRFQQIQQIVQKFWSRWSREYVAELQTRTKWKVDHSNLAPGQLVLLRDDNLPPLKWSLGRVISVHPGPDAKVRVASVKTQNSVVKRSFSKICPLPIETTD